MSTENYYEIEKQFYVDPSGKVRRIPEKENNQTINASESKESKLVSIEPRSNNGLGYTDEKVRDLNKGLRWDQK